MFLVLCFFALTSSAERCCVFSCFMCVPRNGLLGLRIYVCSVIVDTAKQLPEVVVPGYVPSSQCIRVCIAPNPCHIRHVQSYILAVVVSHCDLYCNSLIRIRLF